MAKVVVSQGRIIYVEDGNSVFTALKEADGEDNFLSGHRFKGGRVVKVPKSHLGDVAHRRFDLFAEADQDADESVSNFV